MKIHPVGPEMVHADRWTHMTNCSFSQFCKHV